MKINRNILLAGPSCSGKSTLGKAIVSELLKKDEKYIYSGEISELVTKERIKPWLLDDDFSQQMMYLSKIMKLYEREVEGDELSHSSEETASDCFERYNIVSPRSLIDFIVINSLKSKTPTNLLYENTKSLKSLFRDKISDSIHILVPPFGKDKLRELLYKDEDRLFDRFYYGLRNTVQFNLSDEEYKSRSEEELLDLYYLNSLTYFSYCKFVSHELDLNCIIMDEDRRDTKVEVKSLVKDLNEFI